MKKLILILLLFVSANFAQTSKLLLLMDGETFTPQSIDGLILWLKYDEGTTAIHDSVSQWNDLSGGGYNFGTSVLSERPIKRNSGVDFEGTANFSVTNAVPLGNTFTFFINMVDQSTGGTQVWAGETGNGGYWGRSSPTINFRPNGSNEVNWAYTRLVDSMLVFELIKNDTSLYLYVNNISKGYKKNVTEPFNVKYISGFTGYKSNIVVNEVIGYNRVLSETERQSLYEKYFNKKTYKRFILCDGNSITYGSGAGVTLPYPTQLQTLLGNNYFVKNMGIPGASTVSLTPLAAGRDNIYTKIGGKAIYVLEIGNNDLTDDSTATASTVYQRIKTFATNRRTAGYKVAICTITQRGNLPDTQWDIRRLAVNDSIRAYYTTFADGLVDLAIDPRLETYNTTYFCTDKVHPNDAGLAVIAELVYAVIKGW